MAIGDWHELTPGQLDQKQNGFVAHVYLAWLRSHFPETPVREKGYYPMMIEYEIMWAAADALSGHDGSASKERHEEATCPEAAFEGAKILVRDVMAYYKFCLRRADTTASNPGQ